MRREKIVSSRFIICLYALITSKCYLTSYLVHLFVFYNEFSWFITYFTIITDYFVSIIVEYGIKLLSSWFLTWEKFWREKPNVIVSSDSTSMFRFLFLLHFFGINHVKNCVDIHLSSYSTNTACVCFSRIHTHNPLASVFVPIFCVCVQLFWLYWTHTCEWQNVKHSIL